MVEVRQPDFEFEEEEIPEFNWNNMTQEEIDKAVEKLSEFNGQEEALSKRYQKLIPNYANTFFENYFQHENNKLKQLGALNTISILDYLEYGFEVDMNKLKKQNKNKGIVEFSTGNFPYGGIERFFIVLNAFEITPVECFDGFTIYELEWITNFEYNTTELIKKTEKYLSQFKN